MKNSKPYKLLFLPSAEKEWKKLGEAVKVQFRKKLRERLEEPRVPSAALRGMSDCYKIKLHDAGYRLIYQVWDEVVTVTVIAVGRRDQDIYAKAGTRQSLL